MPFRLTLILALSLLLSDEKSKAEAATGVAMDARVSEARKILAEYQAGALPNHRVLSVAYFCPADRTPAPDYQARIERTLGDISQFYSRQVRQYGLPCDGIPLDRDAAGDIIVHLVKGARPAAAYSESKSFGEIRQDVLSAMAAAGSGLQTNYVLVFNRLGNYDGTHTSHNSPYAGSGNARSGFCQLFDSEILDLGLLQNTNQWIEDHQYGHISLGTYNSIFIGGEAHELGHLFGLPHNTGTADDLKKFGHALMGDGNRHYREELRGDGKGSYLTLAHALRLVSNPLFSHVDKGLEEDWKCAVVHCQFEAQAGGGCKCTGQFQSSQPVYGVVAYVDPDGGGDYNAVSYVGKLGPDHSFTFDLNPLPNSRKSGEIRICILCASGQHLSAAAASQARFRYRIGQSDGRMEVDASAKTGH